VATDMQQDTPSQVRIRTGDGNEYRYEAIEQAADFYDCNKTKAVVAACEDVPELVSSARQVLAREDLTLQQRKEIADTLSTRAVSFKINNKIGVEYDP
jgi:hypothetical protein